MPKSAFNCSDFFLRASDNGSTKKQSIKNHPVHVNGLSLVELLVYLGYGLEN